MGLNADRPTYYYHINNNKNNNNNNNNNNRTEWSPIQSVIIRMINSNNNMDLLALWKHLVYIIGYPITVNEKKAFLSLNTLDYSNLNIIYFF